MLGKGFTNLLFDMCQFEQAYKKRTRVRSFKLKGVPHLCTGGRSTCSASGAKHTVLTGLKDKAFVTAACARYPTPFAAYLARLMHNAILDDRFRRKWMVIMNG